jgi:hypothetical protein
MNWSLLLELLPQLLQAVAAAAQTVEQATGKTSAEATAEVINHLTPGQPNSPTLSTPSA